MAGMRPVVQIMFGDFTYLAMDIIANQAGQWHYISDGALKVPMVIEAPSGARGGAGYGHSQSLEAAFLLPPGLKVAVPSSPYDAKGLMKSAIRDVKRKGRDVTLVAVSSMVHKALRAAETLSQEGIEVEIIDPRTLVPLDKETIFASLEKTNRLVVAEEGRRRGGFGAELAAIAAEEWFDYLDAPVERLGATSTPLPYSPVLEAACIPGEDDIIQAARRTMGREG